LNAPDNSQFGSVNQDDYDTWVGESALVRWGSGPYSDQGWIRYNRHGQGALITYMRMHTLGYLRWPNARLDQYPDRVVRYPLSNPPN